MSNNRRKKYLALAVGAATVGALSAYHYSYSEEDDEFFIMEDMAREYWLKGGVGYCGSEMRPNFKVVKEEARNGNVWAALRLGQVYDSGFWGVKKDPVESFNWYLLAAEGGIHAAQAKVGFCYEIGKGVDANESEAVKWYEKAYASGKYDHLKEKIDAYRQANQ